MTISHGRVWMDFDRCQQFGCSAKVETWCPLCRGFFCSEHDELYPARRHDCLRGKAEVRDDAAEVQHGTTPH